jgi:hypothetical protein
MKKQVFKRYLCGDCYHFETTDGGHCTHYDEPTRRDRRDECDEWMPGEIWGDYDELWVVKHDVGEPQAERMAE